MSESIAMIGGESQCRKCESEEFHGAGFIQCYV